MVDLSDTKNSLLIKDEALESINYITASVDRLYYTNRNKIYCYSLRGKKLWKFKDSTILMNISGLTIGKHHIIYVASRENNSIFVISPNGENVRRILRGGDGIADPRGLFINGENDNLLITNHNGTAFLYKSTITQRKLIQLFIKGIDWRTQTLSIDSNAMISELLKKTAELTGIDEDHFRLLHRKKLVCDKAMSIEDYNISDEETLSLFPRIISGRMQKRR
ncbi:unnamed protein product [Mytilus edulis]|uniref:Ubiquitin-like domain-containing protein n=1 Tax=Mytilus edulis TaxID=6550 RepID=A0A8S3R157_MYTED|nr:unnamed protein product [Mytilus edulis]